MGSWCANTLITWPALRFLCCLTSGGGWRSILHNLRQDARIKLIHEGSVMGLKMALFMFAVHTSAEIIVKWTCLEELQQDWGPWCQNMSQLCPSRSRCCRTAKEMFILFVLLWYFWYWIMVYFNKSTKWGVDQLTSPLFRACRSVRSPVTRSTDTCGFIWTSWQQNLTKNEFRSCYQPPILCDIWMSTEK